LKSKREIEEERRNPYGGIERQLLNTFFSGIYISAKEFLDIGREMGFDGLALKNRELLIKEIVAQADREGRSGELAEKLNILITKRVKEYSKLMENYPKTTSQISQLIQKANATKRLIQTMSRIGKSSY